MSDQRAYVRVYHSIIDDPKFVEVYDDDRHLACWLRLLISADQAWPASAAIPAAARRLSFDLLVRVGLVDRMPGSRYRIHGLDSEREGRASSARNAAAVRWQSGRNASASDARMPSQAKPSKAKPSRAEQGASDPADTYWTLTGKYPTDKTLAWIDDLTEQYGADVVIRHLAASHQSDPNVRTLLGRVQDLCRVDERQLSLKERAAEKSRIAERRRDPALTRAYHQSGAHVDAPDADCQLCKGDAA